MWIARFTDVRQIVDALRAKFAFDLYKAWKNDGEALLEKAGFFANSLLKQRTHARATRTPSEQKRQQEIAKLEAQVKRQSIKKRRKGEVVKSDNLRRNLETLKAKKIYFLLDYLANELRFDDYNPPMFSR
jgi:hypothetical protein